MVRTSHSAAARGWVTRCASPKGDSRVVSVTTNITATDDTIILLEQGQYQFVIHDTTCSASATRRRSYRLVQRAGEAAPAAPSAAPSAEPAATSSPPPPPAEPPPAVTPRPGACEPGTPARLEVTPGRKLARSGDAFDLVWKATDAAGCPVAVRPRFEVVSDLPALVEAVRVSDAGRVSVAPEATLGTAEIVVTLGGRSARVSLEITTPERFDALLEERGLDPLGEGDAAVLEIESAVGGTTTAAKGDASDRRTAFLAVVGGAAAALAIAALALLRRNRRPAPMERVTLPAAAPLVALYDRPAEDDPMRCPQCRGVFPPGDVFCPTDGVPLVPAPKARVASRGTPPPPAVAHGKVCPTCGGRYDESSSFCGRDGTQLVVVN